MSRGQPVTSEMLLSDDTLPRYAFGGYSILYVTTDKNRPLCAACATEAHRAGVAMVCGTYDEGPTMECEGHETDHESGACHGEIESSYGDPDEPEPDDDIDGDNAPDSAPDPDSDTP